MRSVFQSVLLALARATNLELANQVESLIQQNQFLKTENQVLRGRLSDRVIPTPDERRLLMKFGAPLGNAIKDLITIVGHSQPLLFSDRKPGPLAAGDWSGSGGRHPACARRQGCSPDTPAR